MVGPFHSWLHYFLWVTEGSLTEMTHLLSWLLSLILLVKALSQVLGNQAIMPHGNWNWELVLVLQGTSAAGSWKLCHGQVSAALSSFSFCLSASLPTANFIPYPPPWIFSLPHNCLLVISLSLLGCARDHQDSSGLALLRFILFSPNSPCQLTDLFLSSTPKEYESMCG